jgi:hypothetical protein
MNKTKNESEKIHGFSNDFSKTVEGSTGYKVHWTDTRKSLLIHHM